MKKLARNKLDNRSDKCLFMVYIKKAIRYYFYYLVEQKMFVSKNFTFLEKEFLLDKVDGTLTDLKKVREP